MKKSEKVLLALLRVSLSNREESLPNNIEWHAVLELAERQGVLAVSFDALETVRTQLGQTALPDMDTLMDWLGQVSFMETQYSEQDKVLDSLTKFLAKANIEFIVLKGQPLSHYYPHPNHRPVGDIDIYAFDKYEQINQVVENCGIAVEYEQDKHSIFYYKGLMVENHKTLFDVSHSRIEKQTEKLALKSKKECILTERGFYLLHPQANYLFLLRHLAKHFGDNEGMSLRQIIDFGLFIENNKLQLNVKDLEQTLKESKLMDINNILISIASDVIGFDFSSFIFGKIKSDYIERVYVDMFQTQREMTYTKGYKYYIEKIKVLYSQRWKYTLLPESYYSRIRRAFRKNL